MRWDVFFFVETVFMALVTDNAFDDIFLLNDAGLFRLPLGLNVSFSN